MKTLSISLYNRPEYTKVLLDHLDQCFGIEYYDITICCDPGSKAVEKLAKNFRPNQTNVIVNDRRFGCNTNIYQSLAIGFSKSDYHIHLEDDTIPGKDCLKYFEWANGKYKEDKNIFTVSGYVNSDNKMECYYEKNSNVNNVSRRCWFTPWGWATWKDRFDEMESVWDFQGKNGSWDVTINETRKGRWELIPTVARTKNIGAEMGTHVPNAEWHKSHHLNEWWIESIQEYTEEFTEV